MKQLNEYLLGKKLLKKINDLKTFNGWLSEIKETGYDIEEFDRRDPHKMLDLNKMAELIEEYLKNDKVCVVYYVDETEILIFKKYKYHLNFDKNGKLNMIFSYGERKNNFETEMINHTEDEVLDDLKENK